MISNIHIFNQYKSFIFDFDGVILDSNNIKKNAIEKSVDGVLNANQTNDFVNYFTRLNGVPREEKIAKFIPSDKYDGVLNKYESLINEQLQEAKLIPGIREFLQCLHKANKEVIVLSGGTQTEVLELLIDRQLDVYFSGVYGGPFSKEENLKQVSLQNPVLYFGDSEVDYNVSTSNNFDFVFVYGATNIYNWAGVVAAWKHIASIKDFNDKVII